MLAAAVVVVRQKREGRQADLQGVGRPEGGLRLRVEVDAQLLEVGRRVEVRVDARGRRLEQRELGDVALGRLEELVRPGALEGGQLVGREEALQAVVEVLEVGEEVRELVLV